jgi:hypothetical protein
MKNECISSGKHELEIKTTINNILSLNPSYITFELTEDCSVFFQTSVKNKSIYLELFFTKDVVGEVEAITNIYENGKCIFAYGGSIEDAFSQIDKQLNKNTSVIEQAIDIAINSLKGVPPVPQEPNTKFPKY